MKRGAVRHAFTGKVNAPFVFLRAAGRLVCSLSLPGARAVTFEQEPAPGDQRAPILRLAQMLRLGVSKNPAARLFPHYRFHDRSTEPWRRVRLHRCALSSGFVVPCIQQTSSLLAAPNMPTPASATALFAFVAGWEQPRTESSLTTRRRAARAMRADSVIVCDAGARRRKLAASSSRASHREVIKIATVRFRHASDPASANIIPIRREWALFKGAREPEGCGADLRSRTRGRDHGAARTVEAACRSLSQPGATGVTSPLSLCTSGWPRPPQWPLSGF